MKISPMLISANIICLLINTAFLLLAIFKACSFLISVAIFLVCIGGMVWLSCRINGLPPKKFHAARTEPIKRMRI